MTLCSMNGNKGGFLSLGKAVKLIKTQLKVQIHACVKKLIIINDFKRAFRPVRLI